MKNSLYTISIVLILIWAIATIGFGIDGVIHTLLVIGIIIIMIRLIQGKKVI